MEHTHTQCPKHHEGVITKTNAYAASLSPHPPSAPSPEVGQPNSEMTTPKQPPCMMVDQAIISLGGAKSQPPACKGRMEAYPAAMQWLHGGHPFTRALHAVPYKQAKPSPELERKIKRHSSHNSASWSVSTACKHTRTERTTACWSLCAKKRRMSNATSGPNKCRLSTCKGLNTEYSTQDGAHH